LIVFGNHELLVGSSYTLATALYFSLLLIVVQSLMKTAVIILAVVSAMIFVDSENISFDDIQ
jgi:hypothetical protein